MLRCCSKAMEGSFDRDRQGWGGCCQAEGWKNAAERPRLDGTYSAALSTSNYSVNEMRGNEERTFGSKPSGLHYRYAHPQLGKGKGLQVCPQANMSTVASHDTVCCPARVKRRCHVKKKGFWIMRE
jgi:hypothetical protein